MPNGDDTQSVIFTHQGKQYSISGVPKGLQDAEVYEWARINKPKFAALNLPSPAAKKAHVELGQPLLLEGYRQEAAEKSKPGSAADPFLPAPLGYTDPAAKRAYASGMHTRTKVGAEMVGGAIGGGAGSVGARIAGAGIGAAAGNIGAQSVEGKVDFWEAAKTGAAFSLFEFLGEAGTAGFRAVSRLFRANPELKAVAGDLISTEERTRDIVQTNAPKLREAANASYPPLPDVPIMPAARTAQASEAAAMRTSVEGIPKQVGKLADIGRTRQREALQILIRARKVLQQQGATPEVVQLLEKARKTGTMPAIDAQQVKSALGRLMSKGNLPGQQYQAVKEAYEDMKGSIEQVATDSGQLAAYQAAEGRVAQWHADFDNEGAPLKAIMDAKPDERGEILKHLLSKPETRVRAVEALKRNGFNTTEIERLAQKYRDPTQLNRDIEMTARFESQTEKAFNQAEVAATRSRVGKRLGYAAGTAIGGTLLYKLYKELGGKMPNLLP